MPATHPRRFRFSLRSLFVLMTVVALLIVTGRAFPLSFAFAMAFTMLVLASVASVAAMIYVGEAMLTAASRLARRISQRE